MKNPGHRILHSVGLAGMAVCIVTQPGCSNLKFGKDAKVSARHTVVDENQLSPAERQRRFVESYRAGMTYAQQKSYAEAMAAFEEASRMRPNSTETLFNLAACYESIGDPLRAIGIYNKILRLTPDDPDCYHNLGTSYMKLYYLQKSPAWRRMAVVAWEKSLKLRPDQPKLKMYLARSSEEH